MQICAGLCLAGVKWLRTPMTLPAEVAPDEQRDALQVLIIDDDVAVQRLMTTLLSRRGAVVKCVGDGTEGLAALDGHVYDAIVLDLMLPRQNGFDVIAALRVRSPDVLDRVIVVTAVSEHQLRMLDRGAVRMMLRKPFDIDEFIRAVFACGGRGAGRRPLAGTAGSVG